MAKPSVTSVHIPGVQQFNAESVSIDIATPSSLLTGGSVALAGVPQLSVEVVVNAHDTVNLPYSSLLELINLAQKTTADQIGKITITFWKDDSRKDVVCSCSFQGWINNFQLHSGGDGNHMIVMHLVPSWTDHVPGGHALSVTN